MSIFNDIFSLIALSKQSGIEVGGGGGGRGEKEGGVLRRRSYVTR